MGDEGTGQPGHPPSRTPAEFQVVQPNTSRLTCTIFLRSTSEIDATIPLFADRMRPLLSSQIM